MGAKRPLSLVPYIALNFHTIYMSKIIHIITFDNIYINTLLVSVETQQSSYNSLFKNKLFHAFMQSSVFVCLLYKKYLSDVQLPRIK